MASLGKNCPRPGESHKCSDPKLLLHVIPAAFSAAPPLIGTLPFVTTKRTDGTWESVIQELLDMRLVGYL